MKTLYFEAVSYEMADEVSKKYADSYGGENAIFSVKETPRGAFVFEVSQYYSKNGELKLTITQPFGRAMRTFLALLDADGEEEANS